MSQFVLQPLGPYSLRASAAFLEGFAPAAYAGGEMADHLHLAFVADGSEQIAGVCLRAQVWIISRPPRRSGRSPKPGAPTAPGEACCCG